jgi:hypothetical protein
VKLFFETTGTLNQWLGLRVGIAARWTLGPGRQIPPHPERGLGSLIITRNEIQPVITHPLIELLGRTVAFSNLQGDAKNSRHRGTLLEPLQKLLSNAEVPVWWRDGEQVQMRVVLAVTHDGKADNSVSSRATRTLTLAAQMLAFDARRRPLPLQSVLDQSA